MHRQVGVCGMGRLGHPAAGSGPRLHGWLRHSPDSQRLLHWLLAAPELLTAPELLMLMPLPPCAQIKHIIALLLTRTPARSPSVATAIQGDEEEEGLPRACLSWKWLWPVLCSAPPMAADCSLLLKYISCTQMIRDNGRYWPPTEPSGWPTASVQNTGQVCSLNI